MQQGTDIEMAMVNIYFASAVPRTKCNNHNLVAGNAYTTTQYQNVDSAFKTAYVASLVY